MILRFNFRKFEQSWLYQRIEEPKGINKVADQFSFACFVQMVWSDIIIVNRVR